MSTPPKSRRFRIRRLRAPGPAVVPQGEEMPFSQAAEDDGFGDLRFVRGTTARPVLQPPPDEPAGPADEAGLAAIRAEGLTARQLRLARRSAARQGIEVHSDEEAVLLLRRRGIDPFRRESILEMIQGGEEEENLGALVPAPGTPKSPAARGKSGRLPSTEVMTENERARAIMDMQRDIVRRRQRNFALLMTRLAFFVLLPTLLAGWYFYRVATPFYATKAEFLIQQADQPGGGGIGSMFRGTQFATSQDAIAVQGFLQSRDALKRLDAEEGYRAHFSQEGIDPLQRLEPAASDEDTYRLYQRNVKVAYDPTEGLIRMEVAAIDPASSQRFAEALLSFAEERVDALTAKVRDDQMKGARDSYAEAEVRVREAEEKVLALQEQLGILDPKAESSVVMGQVAELQGELRLKELELGQLLDNAQPNQARVAGVRGDMQRLQAQIDELRASMTETSASGASLASVTGQIRIAETELQTRQAMLAKALEQQETARIEANRQVRYLSLSVAPIAPDEPTYPRAFENTALAFMVFMGIYLMMSLTASILREQVTA
jgi:capsular polysaccharide transport system permease protein